MSETFLNVAAIRRRSRVNGPGLRNAVWVQGCTIRCPGCFNPGTHPHEARALFDPERLAEQLYPEVGVEGLSLLGGEPFEQADAAARLASRARALGASVVTWTGYRWPTLRASTLPEVRALIAATDLLIAGPYARRRPSDGQGWHGSTNQEFVFLTSRYDSSMVEAFAALPVVEARADGATLDWTGIPAEGDGLEAHFPSSTSVTGQPLPGGVEEVLATGPPQPSHPLTPLRAPGP